MGMTRPPTKAHEVEESHRESVESVPTARCTRSETPTVHVGHEKGKSKILGTVSEGNEKRAENEGTLDTDMVWVDSNINENNSSILNSKNGGHVEELRLIKESHNPRQVSEHVENETPEGLVKARPTWKRIARMVDGLDVSNEVSISVLGKRHTRQKEVHEGWGFDETVQKREKVDMQITQKTKAAGVSNHPCQTQ